MRGFIVAVLCLLVHPCLTFAEVTRVTVTSRTPLAGGQSFGATGPYERLVGRIEFALDPGDPHNVGIVDLNHAPRDTDGRVRFSSDLYVLRPTDPSKGNSVLLFEVANRGRRTLLGRFNRAAPSADSTTDADVGDGLLMRAGYTLVWIGWEFDVPAPLLRIEAPPALRPAGSDDRLSVEIMHTARVTEAFLVDDPTGRPPVIYPPANPENPSDVLTVRDRFWDEGRVIPRERWRFVVGPNNLPKLRLDTGFEPGRYYRVTYRPTGALVAGVGLAAIRDAAAAFRYRSDLPIHGQRAYAFGVSQAGRFLRQFLYEGFNVDERDRRVFDAMWIHIAGAARVGFNARFATPSLGELFTSVQFPFADVEQMDVDGTRGSLQGRYRPDQQPKIFYTNTPVEYWGGGRAAALTHTTIDGRRDLVLPENVRMYLLAGTQHGVASFPPVRNAPNMGSTRSGGLQLPNPTPQNNVMRGLLHAWHEWTSKDAPPPPNEYPRLSDGTLVSIADVRFPALKGVADPREITGPGRTIGGKVVRLPHLVPQVDRDGNDIAGLRDPEIAVPLATTTGWNFRDPSVGNPQDIYQLVGSYLPFAQTQSTRDANGDLRLSLEERYRGVDDYLQRIRSAAMDLIRRRYLLAEDFESIIERARIHWTFATREAARPTASVLTQEPLPLSELKTVMVAEGVELHYVDRGKGDAIIFVHGGMNDYTMWANQIGPFAEKYRVIAYSRRYNTPNTNKVQPNYSPLVDAEDLGTLIGKLDLGKVHVVGSSFGARVALFFAVTHPELVRTLVLQEAPIMFTGDPTPEAKAQNDRAMRLALGKGDREAAIQGILDGISGGRAKFKELPADRQQWMLRNFEEMEAYHNNPVEPTIDRDAMRMIKTPTLLLSGEQSPPLWKPIEAELLRLLTSREHVVIRGASHGMIRTHPEQTNAAIFQFLQGK